MNFIARLTSLLFAALTLIFASRALIRAIRHYSFDGKTIVISGGSRGLGLILARKLGRLGARLVLLARDEDELSRAKEKLSEDGFLAITRVCNVTVKEDVDEAIEFAKNELGTVDVLINVAGVIEVGPLDVMSMTDYESKIGHMHIPVLTSQPWHHIWCRAGQGSIEGGYHAGQHFRKEAEPDGVRST